MGIPILILGNSGAGKSTSMRNFNDDEICIFNVAGKPLPFRKKFKKIDNPNYSEIINELNKDNYSIYVIDDSQYLMTFGMFARAKEKGYDKFTDMALEFYNLIKFIIEDTPPHVIVYFLHHTEQTDDGKIKAKTNGKMIDNQLTLEGLFSVVLLAKTNEGKYYFETQSNGFTTCKSPMDMFPLEIDNDLKFVDKTIREYWDIQPRLNTEQQINLFEAVGKDKQIFINLMREFGYTNNKLILAKDYDKMFERAKEITA